MAQLGQGFHGRGQLAFGLGELVAAVQEYAEVAAGAGGLGGLADVPVRALVYGVALEQGQCGADCRLGVGEAA